MVLPKSMRLKGHRCFDYLYKSGTRFHEASLSLNIAYANPQIEKSHKKNFPKSNFQCAVAISSKVSKSSVQRNKLRRILHNHLAIRLLDKNEIRRTWALFSLKPKAIASDSKELLYECDKLLFKAGIG